MNKLQLEKVQNNARVVYEDDDEQIANTDRKNQFNNQSVNINNNNNRAHQSLDYEEEEKQIMNRNQHNQSSIFNTSKADVNGTDINEIMGSRRALNTNLDEIEEVKLNEIDDDDLDVFDRRYYQNKDQSIFNKFDKNS